MKLVLLGFLIFVLFIFSTAFNFEYSYKTSYWIIGVCLFLVILGFYLKDVRKLEDALIQFLPEGIIMKTKQGYIPIKYGQIRKIPMSDFSTPIKSYFYLYTEDSRKYEIKIDTEIYDVLEETFPDKI